jgi:hypothetical protein
MKPRILSLLAVGLLAVPVAGTVSAATILGRCTTWTSNDVAGGDQGGISCPTFDSTLGQLTGIAFSMFGSGTGAAIHLENNGSSAATTDELVVTIRLLLLGEGIDLNDVETFPPFPAQTVQPGASFDSPPFDSSQQWSGSVAESVWWAFQSAIVGPEVEGGFLTFGNARVEGFPRCDFIDDLCGTMVGMDLLFTGELTYTYEPFIVPDPDPVPEPGTFTLLVLGLAGVGLMRQRKA